MKVSGVELIAYGKPGKQPAMALAGDPLTGRLTFYVFEAPGAHVEEIKKRVRSYWRCQRCGQTRRVVVAWYGKRKASRVRAYRISDTAWADDHKECKS